MTICRKTNINTYFLYIKRGKAHSKEWALLFFIKLLAILKKIVYNPEPRSIEAADTVELEGRKGFCLIRTFRERPI